MSTAYISIGSNIDPEIHIANALNRLQEDFSGFKASSIYASKAVGFEGDTFLNLMVKFDTDMTVPELYNYLHKMEDIEGRVRLNGKAWDSRTLDLDIILFDNLIGTFDKVELPSKEIEQYLHVYQPLIELESNICNPVTNALYSDSVVQDNFRGQEVRVKTL